MHTAATPVVAMAPPLPTAASICLNHGQERLQNPLCLPRFRRIRSPLKSACGELQTSEPTTVMIASTSIRMHRVTVHVRERGVAREFLVPEDQYILHTAESQNITLPFACRISCCTSCAVRVKSGQIRQPEALGISAELKDKGYALLCVGFPSSDFEVETQDEDEERDDYALELSMGDE